jgi:hypothetical protein
LSSGTDGFADLAFFRRKGKQKSQSQAKKVSCKMNAIFIMRLPWSKGPFCLTVQEHFVPLQAQWQIYRLCVI